MTSKFFEKFYFRFLSDLEPGIRAPYEDHTDAQNKKKLVAVRRKMAEIFAFYVKNVFYYFRSPERLRPKSPVPKVPPMDLPNRRKFEGNRTQRLGENAIRMRTEFSRFGHI